MLSSDEVRQTPKADLIDSKKLVAIKQAILAIEDIDDRYFCLYALVLRLLEEDLWEKAEEFTRLMENWPIEQSWFLGDIAAQARRAGNLESSHILFMDAIELSRKNGRAWQRAESMLRIATHYIEIGDRKIALELLLEAVEIARNGQIESLDNNDPQDTFDSSGVLREVVETIAAIGEIDQAKQIAQSILINSRREAAFAKIQELESESRKAD